MLVIRRLLSFALPQMVIEGVAFLLLVVLLQHLFRFLPTTLVGNVISNSFLALGAVGLLVIAGRFLEHRSLSEIGLSGHHPVRHLLFGCFLLISAEANKVYYDRRMGSASKSGPCRLRDG